MNGRYLLDIAYVAFVTENYYPAYGPAAPGEYQATDPLAISYRELGTESMRQMQAKHGSEIKFMRHIFHPNLLEYRLHPSVSAQMPTRGPSGLYYRFLLFKTAKSRTFCEVIPPDFEVKKKVSIDSS